MEDSSLQHKYKRKLPYQDENIDLLESRLFTEKFGVQSKIACQVYLDLKLVKQWDRINVKESNELNIVYLIGAAFAEATDQIIIPVNIHQMMDTKRIFSYFQSLLDEQREIPMLNFGFVNTDSSISYYRIYKGLVSPKE